MLDQINRYLHGFVAIPVVSAIKKQGLFAYMEQQKTFTLDAVCRDFPVSRGVFKIALELLCSLGWLTVENNIYTITRELFVHTYIPGRINGLFNFNFESYLKGGSDLTLEDWIGQVQNRWHCSCSTFADYLDGLLFVPLLLQVSSIVKQEGVEQAALFSTLTNRSRREVKELFLLKGWLINSDQTVTLTDEGSYLLDRIMICASVYSYKPMLEAMETLLSGSYEDVFSLDNEGNEVHIDRNLNVIGSGFQHEKYFHDLETSLLHIFNTEPLAGQPRYIVDCGCGDGSLLLRVFNAIANKSNRGKKLKEYPLTLIGVDYNQKALDESEKNLAGLSHLLIRGDIGKPEEFIGELEKKHRCDRKDMLHIRSFLDHIRLFIAPADTNALAEKKRFDYGGVYVDNSGSELAAYEVVQSTVEHLQKWAALPNRHGLMLLEVHSLPYKMKKMYPDSGESLHFDTYHSLSGQYLLEASLFLLCAAEAGLFPEYGQSKYYPRVFPFRRISLGYYRKKPFTIRYAHLSDLTELEQLEVSWQKELRSSKGELERRLSLFPEGQFVMEKEGTIIGAVYTQRINTIDQLWTTLFSNISSLHDKEGKILQLLGLTILPEYQNRGFADEFIEFVIHYAALHNEIEKIVGVSRCKNYRADSALPLEEYIRKRDELHKLADPILNFHESHGAKIEEVIYNYRPEDRDNLGHGVLLTYNLDSSGPVLTGQAAAGEKISSVSLGRDDIKRLLLSILGKEREQNYSEQTPFMEMGLDSLEHLEFRSLLENRLHTKLNSSFLFQYNTVEALVDYWGQQKKSEEVRITFPGENPDKQAKGAAVIGMAFRFPGADTRDELWKVLEEAAPMVGNLPDIRKTEGWIRALKKEPALGKGGFLDRIDYFDNTFFNFSPLEAGYLDPQQRILLEKSWELFEDAGYVPGSLSGTDTGVFIGACHNDYKELVHNNLEDNEAFLSTGTFSSILANRLSYFYNFKGPSMHIDTACSSSLVAVHEAVRALTRGECSMALAGGVNLICTPTNSRSFFEAGMLSPDGLCYTFDARASGYVRGEGAGLILLKNLDDAIKDNDHIYGVVKGTAVNHCGKSNSLTAPNPESQGRLIRQAYKTAGITAESIGFIETHGTGTALGDPIEIEGLKQAFNGETVSPYCGLSSVKPLFGHLEGAAGIAGLIRVLLSLKHKRITKTGLFESLNPEIDIDKTPFYITSANSEWQQLRDRNGALLPRRAGVSSFGFGGTNAHAVVEEYSSTVSMKKPLPAYTFKKESFWIEPLADSAGSSSRGDKWEKSAALPEPELMPTLVIFNDSSEIADVLISRAEKNSTGYYLFEHNPAAVDSDNEIMLFLENIIEKEDGLLAVLNCTRGVDNSTAGLSEEERKQQYVFSHTLARIMSLYDSAIDLALWNITQQAVCSPEDQEFSMTSSPLWEAGDVISREMPGIWGGCIDIDESILEDPGPLFAEIAHKKENCITFKNRERYIKSGSLPDKQDIANKKSAADESEKSCKKWAVDFSLVPPDSQLEACITYIQEIIAEKMGFGDVSGLDIDIPLRELGMDSITGVKVVNKFKIDTGLDVPVTELYNYPTIKKLAEHIVQDLIRKTTPVHSHYNESAGETRGNVPELEQVAVIGIGCDFPGGGVNSESFWDILEKGVDTISEIPPGRWDINRFFHSDPETDGTCYTKYGGFIEDASGFDPSFFGISPIEAQAMDPQQRVLLKVTWEALENAGCNIPALEGSNTGVFIGLNSVDYVDNSLYSGNKEDINLYSLTGTTHSSASGRLSYVFDFKGPAVSIDTACSSSLVAVHWGIQSLLSGESDLCVVGGVNILSSPNSYIGMSKLRALSPGGRCKAFDDSADGFVRSEGCGILVLKRASEARKNGDTIHALLKGSAVNHDGKSIGFTAPNGLSQQQVIKNALKNAQIQPGQVDYIEAHGTGTKQGDPIEAAALASVFESRSAPLLIGSVKTNIGHLEAASGIAGLIKVILALKQRKVPGNLHFSTPNSHINWSDIPVKVVDKMTAFEKDPEKPLFAGVSSFGMTGTNAHIIVEEAASSGFQHHDSDHSYHILAFSAKRENDLTDMAEQYKHFLETSTESLANICFTSNTSRTFFTNRAAFIGKTRQEIIDQLEQFVNRQKSAVELLSLVNEKKDIKNEKEIALITSYLSGDDVDWEKMYDR